MVYLTDLKVRIVFLECAMTESSVSSVLERETLIPLFSVLQKLCIYFGTFRMRTHTKSEVSLIGFDLVVKAASPCSWFTSQSNEAVSWWLRALSALQVQLEQSPKSKAEHPQKEKPGLCSPNLFFSDCDLVLCVILACRVITAWVCLALAR